MNLVESVRAAGVVGAGGAGFPTHVKLKARSNTILIDGAECEPLLRVDQALMARQAEPLVMALAAVLAATGAEQGVFALKAKYREAVAALRTAGAAEPRLRLVLLGDFYPAGDEHVLVHEVTGRTVPPGGIPPEVGVTVMNVETLLNVAHAAMGEPVIAKYVTVAGAVAEPATFLVPVGTCLTELVSLAGGATTARYGLLDGGSLMGRLAAPGDVVSKTTKGLVILPADHPCLLGRAVSLGTQLRRAASCCCNCRMCTDLCPRYLLGHPLEPHRTLNAAIHAIVDGPNQYTQAYLCSECGVCDVYACPMGLSPRRLHVEMKKELARAGIPNPYHGLEVEPRRERAWRMVPAARLAARLGVSAYDAPAPLCEAGYSPRTVSIPLQQGTGVAAAPLVRPGDYVYRGQCVAAPSEGQLGSCHHASIDGRVTRVENRIEIEAV